MHRINSMNPTIFPLFSRWGVVILLVLAIYHTLPTPTVLAAGPVVNTQLDENDHSCSDGDCSLRDAIETAADGETITLTRGYLTIDKTLTITGTVPITISGNNASRVFYIGHTGAVAMSHMGIIGSLAAPPLMAMAFITMVAG